VSKCFGHVLAAVAKTDMAGLIVNGTGKKKDTSVADNVFAESDDVLLGFETREANGGRVRRGPIQEIGVPRQKPSKQWKIVVDNPEVAVDKFLTMAKSEGGQEFAGGAGADGRVVFKRKKFLQKIFVVGGKPGEAQAREAVGLADGAEADRAVVEVACGRKTLGGSVFEVAVDFVGEDVDAASGGQVENAPKDLRSHVEPGGVVGSIYIERAGIGANESFKSG